MSNLEVHFPVFLQLSSPCGTHNLQTKKREITTMYELISCFFSVGDNSSPFPFVMELWDTVTNNITEVPHPPGFETSRFFRPAMATFDDDSIMVAAAQVFNDDGDYLLDEAWQYKVSVNF